MTPADIIRVKELLPTSLGTDGIRERYAREILSRSVLSARMASAPYLARVREVCEKVSGGLMDMASARSVLEGVLGQMGHSMQDGGGLGNPASIRRLDLILGTQTQMASSVATLASQTGATFHWWSAWELTRPPPRAAPRDDWDRRWGAAGNSVGFEGALKGRFIALKSSPIWAALGAGAGGFRDALGNPYPPFAYSSGMDWVEVERGECVRLGLVGAGGEAPAPSAASLSPGEREIADAVRRYGFPGIAEGLA